MYRPSGRRKATKFLANALRPPILAVEVGGRGEVFGAAFRWLRGSARVSAVAWAGFGVRDHPFRIAEEATAFKRRQWITAPRTGTYCRITGD